jgi:hypothetical protein
MPPVPADEQRQSRVRFVRAALLGAAASLILAVWMLIGTEHTLVLDNGLLGSFYDVQGRALLHGHLYVDPSQVSFEGFRIDGRTYIYFGLFPTLLRLPVLLVTHGLDGRLTQLSMVLALVVLQLAGAVLHWRVRGLFAGDRPLSRTDAGAAFLVQLAIGAGSVPLFLASRTVVYHEAELWGAALSLGAFAAIAGLVGGATPRRIAWAGVLAGLAVNARFSVGLGPVLALGALALAVAAGLWSGRRGERAAGWLASFAPRGSAGARTAGLLVAAALIPLAVYAAVNFARFHEPFGIPIDKQVYSRTDPSRRAALAANGGTIFGVKFIPTTLVQSVRPDAIGTLRGFPFVGLPAQAADPIGDVRFDTIEPSLSALTSMPALAVLTLVGIAVLARRRDLRPLACLLVGGAVAFALTLAIAFITTRYLADVLPFLAVAGILGAVALCSSARAGWLLGGVGLLVAAGVAVNGSVGLASQRLFYEASESDRAAFVRTQDDVDRFLGRSPHGLRSAPRLPASPPGSPGDLFAVDRCAGLYVKGLNRDWLPVERTERSGVHRLLVRFPASEPHPEALIGLGSGPRGVVVTSTRTAAGVVIGIRVGGRVVATGDPVPVDPVRAVPVLVTVNWFSGGAFARVDVGDRRGAALAQVPDVRFERAAPGAAGGGAASFAGRIDPVPIDAPVCRAITARAAG